MVRTILKTNKQTNKKKRTQKKCWDGVMLCTSSYWTKFICRLCAAIRIFLYCRCTLWGLRLLNLQDMREGNVKCLSWWDLHIILTRSSRGNLAKVLSLRVTLRSIFLALITVWIIFNPNTAGFICMVIFNSGQLCNKHVGTSYHTTHTRAAAKNHWISGHCFNHQKTCNVRCEPNQTEWLCV